MSPLKSVAAGVLFLLVAVAGLIYVVARPKPMVQALQPEALPAIEVAPGESPEPAPEESPVPVSSQPPVLKLHIPQLKTFAVELLSPAMAETFVAPAAVKLKASANHSHELKSIEFYSGPFGVSVCQSLTNPEPLGSKIGEALSPPYEFTWTGVAAGTYNIVAVATYDTGEQQLSEPTVVVVNKTANYDGPEWSGWRPPYSKEERPGQDLALLPSPTPTPSLADCPGIAVKSLGPPSLLKGPITFKADLAGNIPKDVTYKWAVSAGEVVAGNETAVVTVNVNTILDKNLVASVEVGGLNAICPNTAFTGIAFARPRWMDEGKRSLLLEMRSNLESIIEEKDKADTQVYVFAQGASESCIDSEILKEARLVKRYLVEVERFKSERILIRNGADIKESESSLEVVFKSPDDDESEELNESIRSSIGRNVAPCQSRLMTHVSHVSAPPINRSCPDVEDRISYRTGLQGWEAVNTCPYNAKDPQNSKTQISLASSINGGIYGNRPTFRYWTNGGKILSDGHAGIWDLSAVKLRPGVYTAIARSDDGCDCPSTNTSLVTVTNFCTPCLRLRRYCDPTEPVKRQRFVADVEIFARAQGATYQWVTSKGTILSGQGTAEVIVDTSSMQKGEEFEVTVRTGGLLGYCVNVLSIKGIVGECPPTPVKFDEFGNNITSSRRARRRPQEMEILPKVGGNLTESGSAQTTTEPDNVEPKLNEKEWMSVSWAPRVKTDENFSITVAYNRTTEALEVSSAPGEISEELKLGGRFKSLREKYGPDYEVLAEARLIVAGITCNTCAQEQFQSLDNEKVEWSWPVSPGGKGTQVFNVELWVKGQPRDQQPGRPAIAPEKVWSRNNLKVDVNEPYVTRNTVFAGGGLCAVLGLGLCVRGLKIYRVGDTYNVGQAVAVGRNVTMNNTTVNQEAAKQDVQSGEKK